ncbi:MAG: hypothetical protein II577_01410 [Erysipelotrichaceae bacterium]|nr:hypothetical protein [Erysipelotrichaceae bacterium]
MSNAYFTIERPKNDAFRGYLSGSKERAELKEELARRKHHPAGKQKQDDQ